MLANTLVGYAAAWGRAVFFADNLLVNAGFIAAGVWLREPPGAHRERHQRAGPAGRSCSSGARPWRSARRSRASSCWSSSATGSTSGSRNERVPLLPARGAGRGGPLVLRGRVPPPPRRLLPHPGRPAREVPGPGGEEPPAPGAAGRAARPHLRPARRGHRRERPRLRGQAAGPVRRLAARDAGPARDRGAARQRPARRA